jgi:hypothetical protein
LPWAALPLRERIETRRFPSHIAGRKEVLA